MKAKKLIRLIENVNGMTNAMKRPDLFIAFNATGDDIREVGWTLKDNRPYLQISADGWCTLGIPQEDGEPFVSEFCSTKKLIKELKFMRKDIPHQARTNGIVRHVKGNELFNNDNTAWFIIGADGSISIGGE